MNMIQTQFEIKKEDGYIFLKSEFSSENNDVFRRVGGKFAGGFWRFLDAPAADRMIAELYGEESPLVTAEVDLEPEMEDSAIQIGGYVLARRRFAWGNVELPRGVEVAAGGWDEYRGRASSPAVRPLPGTTLHLVCRADFARRHNLRIVAGRPPAPAAPAVPLPALDLSIVPVDVLIDELNRRGYAVKMSAGPR